MTYREHKAYIRDIALKGIPMIVHFWFYPPYPATRDEPGFDGEIDIEAIFIDEFDVLRLFGEQAIADVEAELWKIYSEGESL